MAKDGKRKILRVGIIQAGRIVEERLIRRREDVTVGQGSKNTFILPVAQVPKTFPLFQIRGDNTYLVFDGSMEGRVSIGGDVMDLSGLARSQEVKKQGDRYVVELDEQARGKIVIGEFTILFQFVDTPPVLPKPQLPAAARGGLAQRIHWPLFNAFLASLVLLGSAGVGLDIWWRQTGQYLEGRYEQKRSRAYEVMKAEVLDDKEREKKEEEEEEKDEEAEKEEKKEKEKEEEKEEEEEPEPEPEPEPEGEDKKPEKDEKKDEPKKRESKRSKDDIKEAVEKKTFLNVVGSEGGKKEGALGPDTLKDGVATGELDDAFKDLDSGVATAEPGDEATFVGEPEAVKSEDSGYKGASDDETGGDRIETEEVDTGGKEEGGGGGDGGEVEVRANVSSGSLGGKQGLGSVDKQKVKRVFSRRKQAVQYCYEKALKVDENLKGKVVLRFTIGTAGRITSIDVEQNTTGDSSVSDCIKGKVRTWRFPPPEGGSVTFTFPFVLARG